MEIKKLNVASVSDIIRKSAVFLYAAQHAPHQQKGERADMWHGERSVWRQPLRDYGGGCRP